MNYDGVKTLGNFVEEEEETLFDPKCTMHHISDSVAGTVPCVDARLVDSR